MNGAIVQYNCAIFKRCNYILREAQNVIARNMHIKMRCFPFKRCCGLSYYNLGGCAASKKRDELSKKLSFFLLHISGFHFIFFISSFLAY
jgi:hypothetical protein